MSPPLIGVQASPPAADRLVVVSNRLPLKLQRDSHGEWRGVRSDGGLATAMGPILRRTGGIWIGWSGDEASGEDPARAALIRKWDEEEGIVALDMPEGLASTFYEGYPNQAVWPLFHYFPNRMKFDPGGWQAYVDANRRFAEAVMPRARPGDLIWVHDYHLMLLPSMLRALMPDARIGFFLHIPFPSSDVFALLPRREAILEGLLGADLVAFHTHEHLNHFRDALLRLLGLESGIESAQWDGRTVRMEALPIGIAPDDFRPTGESARMLDDLRGRYRGQRVLLAVDRLDYTKGIPERLRAFRRLLEGAPDWLGKVTLIQVAVPSREGIEAYQDLRSEVHELVGEINGRLGTVGWTPIVYINRGIPKPELVALYQLAAVAWVTPLRDGMNLVAKEYAVCHPQGDGALVLSEFAGAAAEMGEASLVNPLDEERTAEAVARALELSDEERRDRMRALYGRLVRNDVFTWGERFLAGLRSAVEAREKDAHLRPRPVDADAAAAEYRRWARRLFLLDYDGTLVPFARLPQHAVPPAGLLETLAGLAADPGNCVVVVSGRRAADLDRWLGGVPGLVLAAEHGVWLRTPAGWESARPDAPTEWKQTVRPILEHFVNRTPGSFVEEKDSALVWHYRVAEPAFASWLANELVAMLESRLAQTELRAVRGQKIVEVKPIWANKGLLVDRLAALCPDPGFLLAMGDDRTDEDMFARLPETAWTVRVGRGETRARYAVPDPAAARRLLSRLR